EVAGHVGRRHRAGEARRVAHARVGDELLDVPPLGAIAYEEQARVGPRTTDPREPVDHGVDALESPEGAGPPHDERVAEAQLAAGAPAVVRAAPADPRRPRPAPGARHTPTA